MPWVVDVSIGAVFRLQLDAKVVDVEGDVDVEDKVGVTNNLTLEFVAAIAVVADIDDEVYGRRRPLRVPTVRLIVDTLPSSHPFCAIASSS